MAPAGEQDAAGGDARISPIEALSWAGHEVWMPPVPCKLLSLSDLSFLEGKGGCCAPAAGPPEDETGHACADTSQATSQRTARKPRSHAVLPAAPSTFPSEEGPWEKLQSYDVLLPSLLNFF